jgi:tetratricopeptide (TPR) repeat protein
MLKKYFSTWDWLIPIICSIILGTITFCLLYFDAPLWLGFLFGFFLFILFLFIMIYSLITYINTKRSINEPIVHGSETSNAYYKRGLIYRDLGKLKEAIKDFERAIELDPENADAYHNCGLVYFKSKRYHHAINIFAKLIEIDSQFIQFSKEQGVKNAEAGKFEMAMEANKRAREREERISETYAIRGTAYFEEAEYEKSIKDFSAALSHGCNWVDIFRLRGLACARIGRKMEAVEDVRKYLELTEDRCKDAKALKELIGRWSAEISD